MADSQSVGDFLNSSLQCATTSAISSEDYHGPAPALAHILISLDLPPGSAKLSPELEREEFQGDGNLYELVRTVLRGRALYGRSITFLKLSMSYLTRNATLARIMQRGGLGYPGIPMLNGRRGVKKLGDLFEVIVSIHFRQATYQASLTMVEHTFGYLITALEAEYQRLGGDQNKKRLKRPRDAADDAYVDASRPKRARIRKPMVDQNTRPPNARIRMNKKKRSRTKHTISLPRGHRPRNKRDRKPTVEPADDLSRTRRARLVEPVADENIQPLYVLTSDSRRRASHTSGKHGSAPSRRRKQLASAGRLVPNGRWSLADCTTSIDQDKSVTTMSIKIPMPSSVSSTTLNQSASLPQAFALDVKTTHSSHHWSPVEFSNDGHTHHCTQARPCSSSRNSSLQASGLAIESCTGTSYGRSSSSASSSWPGCFYGINDYVGIYPHSSASWPAALGIKRGPDVDSHHSGKRSWQQRENIGDPYAPYPWTGNSNHYGGGDSGDRYWPHDDPRVGTRGNEPGSSATFERSQKRQRRHGPGGA